MIVTTSEAARPAERKRSAAQAALANQPAIVASKMCALGVVVLSNYHSLPNGKGSGTEDHAVGVVRDLDWTYSLADFIVRKFHRVALLAMSSGVLKKEL